jgi:hypothetical protein
VIKITGSVNQWYGSAVSDPDQNVTALQTIVFDFLEILIETKTLISPPEVGLHPQLFSKNSYVPTGNFE